MSGRRWVDSAEPFPKSTLIYETHDGEDVLVAASLPSNTPGALINLGAWGNTRSVDLTPDDARKLAKRLVRMADHSDRLRVP